MTTSELVDLIIKAGALASALTAIIVFLSKILKAVRKKEKDSEEIHRKIDILVEHDKDQYLNILRLTIMNTEMPINERLIAGDKYIRAGGNGDVKHYYEELLREHTK